MNDDDQTPPAAPGPATINDEIAAMRRLVNALDGLDPAARARVVTWFVARCAPGTQAT